MNTATAASTMGSSNDTNGVIPGLVLWFGGRRQSNPPPGLLLDGTRTTSGVRHAPAARSGQTPDPWSCARLRRATVRPQARTLSEVQAAGATVLPEKSVVSTLGPVRP